MNTIKSRAYSLITKSLGLVLMKCSDQTPYITDDLGGDFKGYLMSENYKVVRTNFIKDLDECDLAEFNILESRFRTIPNKADIVLKKGYSFKWLLFKNPLNGNRTSLEQDVNIKRFFFRLYCFWKFPKLDIEDSVFYYEHGLVFLPNKVTDYIKGNDFLDIGTFHGDSIIALHKYNFNRIHGFDISKISLEKTLVNLSIAKINTERIKLNCAYVGAKSKQGVEIQDTGKSNLQPMLNQVSNDGSSYQIETITIDDYCLGLGNAVKLIKADVEGALLDVILGSKRVISENRPILLLAVYHNPYEFFEVKNCIQSWDLNYKFMLKKLTHRRLRNAAHIETFLIGVPKELMQ